LQTGIGDFPFSIALGIILLLIALVIVIIMNLITSGLSFESQAALGGPRT
jgi:ABC-type tungstate transport system substrate-binding protein